MLHQPCHRLVLANCGQAGRGPRRPGRYRFAPGRAGKEESYVTPLVCALRARAAMHRGDAPAACRELPSAQHLRPLLAYALPYLAVQAGSSWPTSASRWPTCQVPGRLSGRSMTCSSAWPGLGTLVGQAQALRAQLSRDCGSGVPGASALTATVLRLLALLSTHWSFPEIAGEMVLSATRSSRRRCRSTASWGPPHAARPSPGPVCWGSWRDDCPVFHPIGGMELAPARGRLGPDGKQRYTGQSRMRIVRVGW